MLPSILSEISVWSTQYVLVPVFCEDDSFRLHDNFFRCHEVSLAHSIEDLTAQTISDVDLRVMNGNIRPIRPHGNPLTNPHITSFVIGYLLIYIEKNGDMTIISYLHFLITKLLNYGESRGVIRRRVGIPLEPGAVIHVTTAGGCEGGNRNSHLHPLVHLLLLGLENRFFRLLFLFVCHEHLPFCLKKVRLYCFDY